MVSRKNDRSKRRGAPKTDRDGDLLMGIASQTRSRVGKAPNASSNRSRDHTTNKNQSHKNGVLSGGARRAIARQATNGDAPMKDAAQSKARDNAHGLVEIKITGWENSKASENQDRGVNALIRWLEKKASLRLRSKSREVKIKKSRVVGTDLMVEVPEQDGDGIMRLNGFVWAAAKLQIQRVGAAPPPVTSGQNSKTEETKAMLRSVLERRYDPDLKLLNLSALGQDEELCAQSMFDKKSTASKCFPAMMVILEKCFDTAEELNTAVESVSLANNELQNLTAVTTLAQTLPKLKNLDLSNNQFENLDALSNWRKRFPHLEHLIISNNPLEQNEPNYTSELITRYPRLRFINNAQVRAENGTTIEAAEQMVMELGKQTGMNTAYSKECLEQAKWDFPKALEAFNDARVNLPPEAFIQSAA